MTLTIEPGSPAFLSFLIFTDTYFLKSTIELLLEKYEEHLFFSQFLNVDISKLITQLIATLVLVHATESTK